MQEAQQSVSILDIVYKKDTALMLASLGDILLRINALRGSLRVSMFSRECSDRQNDVRLPFVRRDRWDVY